MRNSAETMAKPLGRIVDMHLVVEPDPLAGFHQLEIEREQALALADAGLVAELAGRDAVGDLAGRAARRRKGGSMKVGERSVVSVNMSRSARSA